MKFQMSKQEVDDMNLWIERHDNKCKLKKKNKPRFFSYCFNPTGIGTAIEIKCSCGKFKDVTDTSCW